MTDQQINELLAHFLAEQVKKDEAIIKGVIAASAELISKREAFVLEAVAIAFQESMKRKLQPALDRIEVLERRIPGSGR